MTSFDQYNKVLLINNVIIENSLLGVVSKVSNTLYYVDPESLRGRRTWEVHTYDIETLQGKKSASDYTLCAFDGKLLEEISKKKTVRKALIDKLMNYNYGNGTTTEAISAALSELAAGNVPHIYQDKGKEI
jgi:hypothetical protein